MLIVYSNIYGLVPWSLVPPRVGHPTLETPLALTTLAYFLYQSDPLSTSGIFISVFGTFIPQILLS